MELEIAAVCAGVVINTVSEIPVEVTRGGGARIHRSHCEWQWSGESLPESLAERQVSAS